MIAVVSAVRDEVADYLGYGDFRASTYAGGVRIYRSRSSPNVAVAVGGIGRDRAVATTEAAIEAVQPSMIFCTGFAGGVQEELEPGDLTVCERVWRPEGPPEAWSADSATSIAVAEGDLTDRLLADLEQEGLRTVKGDCLTVPKVVYGCGAVLPALESLGVDMATGPVGRAVGWVVEHQNRDGGWGESCASYVDPAYRGRGPSTPSQTAWALMSLLAVGDRANPAARRGVEHLIGVQREDGSWDEPHFTGTGFPGYGAGQRLRRYPAPGEAGYQGAELPAGFMINYHMYRNYWPLTALGRYKRSFDDGATTARTHGGVPRRAAASL